MAGALESYSPRQSYGKIGKIAVPGPADADSVDFENALHVQDRVIDLRSRSRRRSVEQGVNGAAGQAPTDENHYAGDEQRGDGIGKPQPGFVPTCVKYRCAASYELSAFTSRLYRLPSPSATVTVHHFPTQIS